MSKQQYSNDRNCMSTSVIYRDIYSSSSLHKKAPKTIKATTSRYVMNHFSSLTNSSRYCFSCHSNRSFKMIHSVYPNTPDTLLQEWQTASKIKSRDLYYVTITVFCHHKRSLENGTSGMRHCDNNTKHLFSTLRSCYVITAVDNRIMNTHKNLNRRSGHRRSDVFRILNKFLPRDGPNWRNWQ